MNLVEHLDEKPKRRIVAGPEATLAAVLALRFKAQRRRVLKRLSAVLDDSPPDQPSAAPLGVSMAVLTAFAGFTYDAADRQYQDAVDAVRGGGARLAAAQLGLEADTEIPQYSRTAQAMTTDVDLTTSRQVLDAIKDAFAAGAGAQSLVDSVEEIFQSALDSRADSIASTEIAAAFNDGAREIGATVARSGVGVEKAWNAEPDACEICSGNEADGWIDMDEPFSSGDDAPEAHPNCRCSLDLRTAE